MNVAELVSNLGKASAETASSRPGGVSSSAAPQDGWQQMMAAAHSHLQQFDMPGILPAQTDTPSALNVSLNKSPDSTKGVALVVPIVADLRGNKFVTAGVFSEPSSLIRETGSEFKELGSKLSQQRYEGAVNAPCFKPAPKSKIAGADAQDVPGILTLQQVALSLPGQLTPSVAVAHAPLASGDGLGKLNPSSGTELGAQDQLDEQQAAAAVKDETFAIPDASAASMPKTAASLTQPPLSSAVQQPEQSARIAESSANPQALELVGPIKPEPTATAEQDVPVTFHARPGVSVAGKERSPKPLRSDLSAPSAPELAASRAVEPAPNYLNGMRNAGTNAPAESPNHPPNQGYAQAAPPLTAGDAFAALDRTAPAPPLTWQHSGAQHAEAGFNDPALGWISVRAQLHGGSVEASLIPSSLSAAAELDAHVSPLNAHLAANNFTSASVSLSSPDQFSGAGTNQHGSQNQQRGQSAPDVPSHSVPAPRTAIPHTPAPLPAHNRNSSHISVVA